MESHTYEMYRQKYGEKIADVLDEYCDRWVMSGEQRHYLAKILVDKYGEG